MEEKIAQEWHLRGFSCDVWVDPPGKRWEDFVHDVDELFLLVKGEVELVIAGKTILPKVDEVILIPANTKHSIRNLGATDSRWLYGYKLKNANESDMTDFNQ